MTVRSEWKGIDEKNMQRLARGLGKKARGGDMICLDGPLGSGKTTFAQAFARGAGYKSEVTSPTFALINEYRIPGRKSVKIYHMDLYRVAANELVNLGLEEYFSDRSAVCLIEWPQVVKGLLPEDRLELSFVYAEAARDLSISASGIRSQALLKSLPNP